MSARRLAMGGVFMPGGGPGSSGRNVAYRAVPREARTASGYSLPIGLVPLLSDPPVLDPEDPAFNAYALANLLYDPPWNLAIGAPRAPSSDVTIAVSKNSLAVDLGEVAGIFPADQGRVDGVAETPAFSVGIRRLFVGIAPLVHFENELRLDEALQGALAGGEPFLPRTEYALFDDARAQAAVEAQLGWAAPLWTRGDPRAGGIGLYAGARAKLLRGLAYADAENVARFTTKDTLFATDPVDIRYVGNLRRAGLGGGRLGGGLDLGLVVLARGIEIGVGVQSIATSIEWRVRESLAFNDSAGDFVDRTLRDGVPYTSHVPPLVTANAATRLGPVLVAADLVGGPHRTLAHLGLETWTGRLAWRAGASSDANRQVQASGGLGVRLGGFGIDVALATHSRNILRERALALGAGLAFYRGGAP